MTERAITNPRAHLHATIENPRQLLEALRAAGKFTFFVLEGGRYASPHAVFSDLRGFLAPFHNKGAPDARRVLRCLERTHFDWQNDIVCAYSGRRIPWQYGSEE